MGGHLVDQEHAHLIYLFLTLIKCLGVRISLAETSAYVPVYRFDSGDIFSRVY